MFRVLVKEYGMEAAQGAFEQAVKDLGVMIFAVFQHFFA